MAKKNALTKREAVRRALADLGPDATPTQMQGHIREKFGIEITTNHISTEKGNLRKKKGVSKRPGAKPAAQVAAARTVGPEKLAAAPPAIGMEDIEAVKGLLERVGATSLKKLIDVMAR
jgi:hypothetical protein